MPANHTISEFLNPPDIESQVIIDVRSPIEFAQGHIPGAVNVPLFDDDQRAEIGTLYRKAGRQEAILRALELTGPRMRSISESVLELNRSGVIHVHCWRGGMRSRSVAWLLEQVDLDVVVLNGGYKSFRRHVLESFKLPLPLVVLSGLTGAGKTKQLQLLAAEGQQVVDLEALANHRGSAFGNIGLAPQPTVEHFENQLFAELHQLDLSKPIWVEDESRHIGTAQLPHHFFEQLRNAPALFMEVDRPHRRAMIDDEYGNLPQDELIASIRRVTKRMGGQNVKAAVEAIESNRMPDAIDLLLDYYDKLYLANKSKMSRQVFIDVPVTNPLSAETTSKLISLASQVDITCAT